MEVDLIYLYLGLDKNKCGMRSIEPCNHVHNHHTCIPHVINFEVNI